MTAILVALLAVAGTRAEPKAEPMVASLQTLPAPSKLPAGYVRGIQRSAAYVGISRAVAAKRTRLLLSDVTGLPLYAFGGTKRRVCFAIWRGGGTCGEVSANKHVIYVVNGGSHRRGQAVAGVVSDRVKAVDVTIQDRVVHVSVRHNAFVVPFRWRRGEPMAPARVRPILR
jgi:hypothetical protein